MGESRDTIRPTPRPLRIEPGLGLITIGAGRYPGSPRGSLADHRADGTKPFDSPFPQPGRLACHQLLGTAVWPLGGIPFSGRLFSPMLL